MMNKILKLKQVILLIAVATFTFSCSSDDNDDLIVDETAEFDAEIIVSEAGIGDKRDAVVDMASISGSTVKVRLKFTSTDASMRRMYITQNEAGTGEEPFVFTHQEVDEKPDGSLDLIGDNKKDLEFQILLPAPNMTNGTVVYKFWTTTGRGDFRDATKRFAVGIGTITLRYGTGVNNASGINHFTQTILAAPLGDGSSETFISLYNNQVYKISDGEETAALWDFGYYYGATNNASLASTSNYPALFDHDNDANTPLVNVSGLTGVVQSELNDFFITNSILDFDAITSSNELNIITKPTSESVTNLSVGNILEFEDQYGHKGVIKVLEISGTDGSGDFIKLEIKVQN